MALDAMKIPPTLRVTLLIACSLLFAVCLLLLTVRNLDSHSRQRRNEATAVSKLALIVAFQNEYAAAHSDSGFACELSLLKPFALQKSPASPSEYLTNGVQSGYKFAIVGCSPEANRAKARYQVTAVPLEQGTTGFRAFCTDDSGSVWYDTAGSGTNCLAFRRTLE